MPSTPAEVFDVEREFKAAEEQLKRAVLMSFVDIGEAMLRMQKLANDCGKTKSGREEWKRVSGCETFEEYIRLKFHKAKQTAYQLMEAATVFRYLEKQSPQTRTLPVGEYQCRWLAKVSPRKRLPKVWAEILDRYAQYRAERAADAKKVSPHPPATFIYKHLAKAGFLAGEDGGLLQQRDSRKVAKVTRRLSGAMEAIDWFGLDEDEERIDQIAEREKWDDNDRKQLADQLDELIEWATRLRERI